jgi:hypothetical protein
LSMETSSRWPVIELWIASVGSCNVPVLLGQGNHLPAGYILRADLVMSCSRAALRTGEALWLRYACYSKSILAMPGCRGGQQHAGLAVQCTSGFQKL